MTHFQLSSIASALFSTLSHSQHAGARWALLADAKLSQTQLEDALNQCFSGDWGYRELTPCGQAYGWLVSGASDAKLDAHKLNGLGLALEVVELDANWPKLSEPGLLLMDMDSTAITIECIDELAALAGVGEAVASVTAAAMRGELDFEQSLRARVAKLEGASTDYIDQLCAELPLMPGIEAMVARLKAHGWKLAVVSGGFMPFVEQLKKQVGLDDAMANTLDMAEGKLLGSVSGVVVDAEYKATQLSGLCQRWGIEPTQSIAIGDGANDIQMIQAAQLGVAYHAKPKLVEAANASVARLGLDSLPLLLEAANLAFAPQSN
ncbi:phosphoserine phosphatase SerB [Paraferrimonas sedimenticola]|uniref:Phosphoserine phosphatase n=1 Tax=Paraferrimonas sedimenticola TaxID=375674 RepID=A0AA37RY87_9GAMM|nr:phosphoserine phosphatase SerB [Paraferrimonas sedimenticola]GLP96947.1 hypothetical protein GCM10007895_22530 [Paraferrimonas sedimenticola]